MCCVFFPRCLIGLENKHTRLQKDRMKDSTVRLITSCCKIECKIEYYFSPAEQNMAEILSGG